VNIASIRKIGFYFSIALVVFSLVGLFKNQLNFALDFTGGYLTEFETTEMVDKSEIQVAVKSVIDNDFVLEAAEHNTIWSVKQADNTRMVKGTDWLKDVEEIIGVKVIPLDAIYTGSQIGDELKEQGGLALLTASLVILIYLAIRFEWRLAVGSLLALAHDIVIVLGVFAWFSIPFDLTVLAALLAIIGYSLNDSIVVGDKIREVLLHQPAQTVTKSIDLAISSTLVRTLITSGTTMTTIVAISLFAGNSLSGFASALMVGIAVGTISSITISATVPELLGLSAQDYQEEQVVDDMP